LAIAFQLRLTFPFKAIAFLLLASEFSLLAIAFILGLTVAGLAIKVRACNCKINPYFSRNAASGCPKLHLPCSG
jgi:hypothetical protein